MRSPITFEMMRNNPDKDMYWCNISCNNMQLEKKLWIIQRRLQHIKAFQIQRHWRTCSCNPEYKLAQRLLSRLYES
jgi:hypothetical protein